jgi:acyl-CoA thioesterase FadM
MGYASIYQGICCVTAKMQVRLRRPALVDEPLIITGMVTKNERKLLETGATLTLKDGTLVAEAKATMFILGPMPREANNTEEKPKNNAQQ